MTETIEDRRSDERRKYIHVYKAMPNYRMGDSRMRDAEDDVLWAYGEHGCLSILDVGCGRGEMLDYAEALGFKFIRGGEIVPELYADERVWPLSVDELPAVPGAHSEAGFDLVTCFDVIEHLVRGDDLLLLEQMARMARRCLAITANNKPSVDPTTGADLHINKREYDDWDRIIREAWGAQFEVERVVGKRYVSETWRAWRR